MCPFHWLSGFFLPPVGTQWEQYKMGMASEMVQAKSYEQEETDLVQIPALGSELVTSVRTSNSCVSIMSTPKQI